MTACIKYYKDLSHHDTYGKGLDPRSDQNSQIL